jgi:hypothetical protein
MGNDAEIPDVLHKYNSMSKPECRSYNSLQKYVKKNDFLCYFQLKIRVKEGVKRKEGTGIPSFQNLNYYYL